MPAPVFVPQFKENQNKATEEDIKGTLRYLLSYEDQYLQYFKSIKDPDVAIYISDFIVPLYKKYNRDTISITGTKQLINATESFLSALSNVKNTIASNLPKNPEAIKLIEVLKKIQEELAIIQNERDLSLAKSKNKSSDRVFTELGRKFLAHQKVKDINPQKLVLLRSKYISAETKFKRNYKILLLKNTNLSPEQMDKEVNDIWDQLLSTADFIAHNTKADGNKIVNDLVKAITEEQLTFDDAEIKVKQAYNYQKKKTEEDWTYEDVLKNWSDKDIIINFVSDIPNESDRNLISVLMFQIGRLCSKFDSSDAASEDIKSAIANEISDLISDLSPYINKYKNIEAIKDIYYDVTLIRQEISKNLSGSTISEQGLGDASQIGGNQDNPTSSVFNAPGVKKSENPVDELARKKKKQQSNKDYQETQSGREAIQKAQERHFSLPEVHEPRRERAQAHHAQYQVWDSIHRAFKEWLKSHADKFASFYNSANAKQDVANETNEILNKLSQVVDKIKLLDLLTPEQKLEKIKLLQKNLQEIVGSSKHNLENNPIQTLDKLLVIQAFDSLVTNGINLLEKRKTASDIFNLIATSSDRFKILSSF